MNRELHAMILTLGLCLGGAATLAACSSPHAADISGRTGTAAAPSEGPLAPIATTRTQNSAPSAPATPAPPPTAAAAPVSPPTAPAASTAGSAAAPALPPPAHFAEAVARAGERLFADGRAQLGNAPRELVIDPLIDAATGAQTASTVDMGAQLAAQIAAQHPVWSVRPLTRATLAAGPLLLIGSLTAVNTRNDPAEVADAFRIWLTLVDLRTGRIVAKQLDRATGESVDAEPTPYYRDSPTWHKDRTVAAYLNSCQAGSKVGDPVDPAYMMRLPAAAVLNEAILAYNDNRLAEAHRLYREAGVVAEADDLRVLNGLYLTSWKLGRRDEAGTAFGRIVAAGLNATRLPLKLLFTPNTAQYLAVADMPAQYALWLREVASTAGSRETCMQVVGHASRTGSAEVNDRLSLRRASVVAQSLERQSRSLSTRLTTQGRGSRETLIGLGTDDLRDALDRRVEFRVVPCR